MNWADDDLYTSPPIEDDEPPRREEIPRYLIAGAFVVIGAGVATKAFLPDLGRLYDVAYAVGLIAAAAATAVVLYRLRRGGAR